MKTLFYITTILSIFLACKKADASKTKEEDEVELADVVVAKNYIGYDSVVNIQLDSTDCLNVFFDEDTIPDIQICSKKYYNPCSHSNPSTNINFTVSVKCINPNFKLALKNTIQSSCGALVSTENEAIGNTLNWHNPFSSYLIYVDCWNLISCSSIDNQHQYLPVAFLKNGKTHFGWLKILVRQYSDPNNIFLNTNTYMKIKLMESAYNDTPGNDILCGQVK
jgi:hypothetical protein